MRTRWHPATWHLMMGFAKSSTHLPAGTARSRLNPPHASRQSKYMASGHNDEWWRPDALLPVLVVVGPCFFNKLIYIYFPSYPVFVATDYTCRIVSLAVLYALLRNKSASLPIPLRLAAPSSKDLMTALVGTIILIGSNVLGMNVIRYLNTHSWQLTRFQLPTNSVFQYFDNTVGMLLVGLSEEAIFRFYLINLLLLRGTSPTMTI